MALVLTGFEEAAKAAVKSFWASRTTAKLRQESTGLTDQGERGSVTAGKNMDGFVSLISGVVEANGITNATIAKNRAVLSLPGYFRPTKLWDVLVLKEGELIAAIELKSQVGPSFGNNFNNRTEEAIGTAHDIWTAYREGAFGEQPPPFIGWIMHVEDAPASRVPVKAYSKHFPVLPELNEISYLRRYDLLCQRLMQEQLYTSAALIASERSAIATGQYGDMSSMTSLRTFVSSLAGHVAAASSRMA